MFALCTVLSLLMPPRVGAQPLIHYVYDDLGRLCAVVDQNGNSARYQYDAVGNITAIERTDVTGSDPVVITTVAPLSGPVGARVSILGRGFSATPGLNAVSFNGAPALVSSATPNAITAIVPPTASTGLVTVTVSGVGSATSPRPFTVAGIVTITPASATVLVKGTRQFIAADPASPAATFVWRVNGVVGGNTTIGTISASGRYTAPVSRPSPPVVAVSATRSDVPTARVEASVLVVGLPGTTSASTPSVSVRVTPPGPPDVSVGAAGVSVQVAATPDAPSASASAADVSLRVADPSALPAMATVETLPVAVALVPVITSVSPAAAPSGSVTSLTLTGAGLTGATSLAALLNGAVDSAITVSALSVNGAGTQATATVSSAAGTPAGARVLRVTTPVASSTAAGTGGNTFTVLP
jgi:YD repeat-containing protein